MNKQESDVLNAIIDEPFINQRITAEICGHSLGIVNKSIKQLIIGGYLDQQICPTLKAIKECKSKSPKNAVILAAGFGMRMVPINMETPKGLLEVNGEPLIERVIKQLHEVGITQIYIVVGFMKEKFEYLIDEYGVELVVNQEYANKNNLHSLKLILDKLDNTYIIPCDIRCENNPFNRHELYSWYMVSDAEDNESSVRVNRKMELVKVSDSSAGNSMIGIAYLLKEQAEAVRKKINSMSGDSRYNNFFWEEALYDRDRMIVQARIVNASDVVEINTYDQLREIDSNSNQLKSDALQVISKSFDVEQKDIKDITVLKKGMTNRSFLFSVNQKKYIMRIPGEGTDRLINRKEEADVYRAINSYGICDNIAYINPDNGYKITEFIENARVCDPMNQTDVNICIKKLKDFHGLNLQVNHTFDIFGQIDFYENLWNGVPSVYSDYYETKDKVFQLKKYIEKHIEKICLTHIDAVPDNFLFSENNLYIIDWEYSGMQDPHVDIAMFCIYSLYNRQQTDRLINLYFDGDCPQEMRVKIYCYIAVCGLLWSNWCEYKRNLGVEFGEYSLRQYRYAKDYYRIATKEMQKLGDDYDA